MVENPFPQGCTCYPTGVFKYCCYGAIPCHEVKGIPQDGRCNICSFSTPFLLSKSLPCLLTRYGFYRECSLECFICSKCNVLLQKEYWKKGTPYRLSEPDFLMGKGDNYWGMLDSIRQRFNIGFKGFNPKLIFPTITALERLGLDSDLVREILQQ